MKQHLVLFGIYAVGLGTPAIWVGCQGETLQLGANDAAALPATLSMDAAMGDDDDAGAEEVWAGYIENYQFPSGSSAVRLTFRVSDSGVVTGQALFGNLPLFPPPTDPDVGYPYGDDGGAGNDDQDVLEGFEFTLRQATLSDNRFLASIAPAEIQAKWCSLQTPILDVANSGHNGNGQIYNCIPNVGSGGYEQMADAAPVPQGCFLFFPDGGAQSINCDKLYLCRPGGPCACDASVCGTSAPTGSPGVDTLDLNVQGNRADGSLVIGSARNVHLTRQ